MPFGTNAQQNRAAQLSGPGILGQALLATDGEPSDPGRPSRLDRVWPALLTLGALTLWGLTLRHVDVRHISDLGLIAVLPPLAFIALIMLTVSFSLTLRQRQLCTPMLLLHLVVLIFMLYGITALVEEVPRFQHTWIKVGVTEFILRTGRIDPKIDHNFNWPGFYILSAFLTEISGSQNPISFVAWVPAINNLLALGPLIMILSSATDDKRLVWLGVWFFYLTNWIGQDYFSPQGLIYVLYLVILGILLRWFTVTMAEPTSLRQRLQGLAMLARLSTKAADRSVGALRRAGFSTLFPPTPNQAECSPRLHGTYSTLGHDVESRAMLAHLARIVVGWLKPSDAPTTPSQPAQRVGLMTIVILLFVTIVSSHQLTPFAILLSLVALVMFNRCTARGLPLILSVLIGTWMSYMAVVYLAGHQDTVTGSIGEVNTAVGANVVERLQGSPEHIFVVRMRLVMSLALWGLALLGGLRRLRRGYWDLTYALLAVAPFPLLVLQPYGGEMLLRVYLFVLPCMAFFAAALFYTTPTVGTSWQTTVVIGLVSIALIGGFFVTRYGNEKMEAFSAKEVEAVHHLYNIAEPGSLLIAPSHNLPWRFQDYEKYRYKSLTSVPEVKTLNRANHDVDTLVQIVENMMGNKNYPAAYLIITRSQKAHDDLFHVLPSSSIARLEQALTESPKFKVIYASDDAKIVVLVDNLIGAGP